MARDGRHYYDIHCLLANAEVRKALADLGTNGGFASSPAFDESGPAYPVARQSYSVASTLVHGTRPTFDECMATVRERQNLL